LSTVEPRAPTLPFSSRFLRARLTCAQNAFVTGDGLRILEPDETFVGPWGIEP
jgi:hypothetical protein